MRRILKKAAAATFVLALLSLVMSPAAYGLRIYDATAQDYPAFSSAARRARTENTLIVKTDGTLPDFRLLHPQSTVQGPDDTYTVTFRSADEAAESLPALAAMRGVEYAEPNALVCAQGEEEPLIAYATYGMQLMRAEQFAADLAARDDLSTVVVAVVDSGVNAELPIFADRLMDGETMNGSPCTEDDFGHGTSVAGVVADCTQGLPVKIMSVRVLGAQGTGTLLDAANGIKYAADNGAAIVNISFVVADLCSRTLHDAVDHALEQGSLPVICAGNNKINMDNGSCCPADYAPGFVVSGCNSSCTIYSGSCYGSTVDLCAPAVSVLCVDVNGTMQPMHGTSFAAPHISALAALFKLYMPDADRAALEKLLRLNARDCGDPGYDVHFGWGVPDLSVPDATRSPSAARTVTRVELLTAPKKTKYNYKETFSADGLSVRVTYSDGTSETRTVQGVVLSDTDTTRRGTQTVHVRFDDRETTFDVTVRLAWWQWLIKIFLFGWIWY